MKPTKNHYYCVACHRPKMLFETQAKANNFIRYNAAEMLQAGTKAPVRSYYCSLCGGWHVTSNPSIEDGERLDQRDNELVKRLEARKSVRPTASAVKAKFSEIANAIDIKLQEYAFLAAQFDLEAAGKLLFELADTVRSKIERIGAKHSKIESILKRIRDAEDDFAMRSRLYALSREELQQMDNGDADSTERLFAHNILCIKAIREVLDSDAVLSGQRLQCLNNYLPEIKGPYCVKVRNVLREKLEAVKPSPSLYRTTILKLITCIETLRDVYAAGHYTECADILGGSYLMLNNIGTDDENIRLIRSHLDQWQTRLAAS